MYLLLSFNALIRTTILLILLFEIYNNPLFILLLSVNSIKTLRSRYSCSGRTAIRDLNVVE